jgi:hypothetical protein
MVAPASSPQSDRPLGPSTFAPTILFGAACALSVLLPALVMALVISPARLDEETYAEVVILALAAIVLGGTPLAGGIVAIAWSADPRTPPGRRHYRTLAMIASAVVLVTSAALILTAVNSSPAAAPVATAIAAGSALGTAASIWAGTIIRLRRSQRSQRPWGADVFEPSIVRRNRLRVVWVFAITFIAVLAPTVAGAISGDNPNYFFSGAIFSSFTFAFAVAGVTGAVLGIPMWDRIEGLFGGDAELRRRVTSAVFGGRTGDGRSLTITPNSSPELNAKEENVAARYAVLTATALPFQYVPILLVLASAVSDQLGELVDTEDGPPTFAVVFVVCVILAVGALSPIAVRRGRRVLRYRDAHPLSGPDAGNSR